MNILSIPILIYRRYFPSKPIESSFGLIEKLKLDKEITNGNWEVVEQKANQLSAEEISRLFRGICQTEKYHASIEQFLKSDSNEFQDVIAGNYYTVVAWKIRTGRWAKEVEGDQWAGFFEYLNKAETRLEKTFSNKAWQLESSAGMIRVCLGLSDKERAIQYFEKCKALDANHYLAHTNLFRVFTPRWMGSNEEMIDFYESIQNPKLSKLIQFMTLVEMYSDLENEEAETATLKLKAERSDLIQSALAIGALPNDDTLSSISYKNYLACLYSVLGMKEKRNVLLKQLKNRVTLLPWAYFGMMSERDIKLFKLGGFI